MGCSDDEDHRAGAALEKMAKTEAMSSVDFVLAKQTLQNEVTAATNVVIGPKGILATLKAASTNFTSAHRPQLEVDHKGIIKEARGRWVQDHDQAQRSRQHSRARVRRELAGPRDLSQGKRVWETTMGRGKSFAR